MTRVGAMEFRRAVKVIRKFFKINGEFYPRFV